MPKAFSCPIGESNLIFTLSEGDRALLEPHLTPVKMDTRMTLEEPDEPIERVYFLKSGVGSTVAFSNNGRRIETGLFGYEGMSGTAAVLQTGHSSHETFMQVAGEGLAIEPGRLQDVMEQSPSSTPSAAIRAGDDDADFANRIVERTGQTGRAARAVAADVSRPDQR